MGIPNERCFFQLSCVFLFLVHSCFTFLDVIINPFHFPSIIVISYTWQTISYNPWFIPFFDEKLALPLSYITNGISTLFQSSCKTARLVEAATMARGSKASREVFDTLACCCASSSVVDEEMKEVYEKYKKERGEMDF